MTVEQLEKEGWQELLGCDTVDKFMVRKRTLYPGASQKNIIEFYNLTTHEIKQADLPITGPKVHPTAIIGESVEIGEGTYIGPFCIIGYPAEHKGYWDEPVGKVIIGKNCVITGHVTIDAGTNHPTIIGNNVWMLKHSHVGHDAIVEDDCTISCGAKVGGHAVIHKKSNLGLNSCIHQWVIVPEGCMIGMNAAVTKKLEMEPYRKYAGVPAKDIGSNIR